MQKKSVHFKGYILIESIFALGVVSLVIGSYMSFNLFLLRKTKILQEELNARIILYEEVKIFRKSGDTITTSRYGLIETVQVDFFIKNQSLASVEVTDGSESFKIEKK